MAAVAINGASPAQSMPPKNVLLRVLDTLAEWLMQQELRIISRGRSSDGV